MEYKCDNCGSKSNRDHVHPESIWLCDRCSITDVDVGKTIVNLKAENKRLKEALEKVATESCHDKYSMDDDANLELLEYINDIATKALESEPDDAR